MKSRTLTGAWIETIAAIGNGIFSVVAPSRVRGLKRRYERGLKDNEEGRTLTGAWIETAP